MKSLACLLLCTLCSSSGAVFTSDGSSADVQTKINSAVTGDTVVMTNSGVWSTMVVISNKAITFTGSSSNIWITNKITTDAALRVYQTSAGFVNVGLLNFDSSGTTADPSITYHFQVWYSTGRPVLLHNCFFRQRNGFSNYSIDWNTLAGVVWHCGFYADSLYNGVKNRLVGANPSWTTASTFGMDDLGGTNNFYIEDCWFFQGYNGVFDPDDNSRSVFRYNKSTNGMVASHGPDSSEQGVRHTEIYKNTFIYNEARDFENGSSIASWCYLRGGTYVICSNAMNDILYGKSEVLFFVQNLRRPEGPYACWGASTPGIQYPAPRQIGQSHDGATYITDPTYIVGNTGTTLVSLNEYAPNGCGVDADFVADYIIAGRDWTNGIVKPGWVPYTYPHPLRTAESVPAATPAMTLGAGMTLGNGITVR